MKSLRIAKLKSYTLGNSAIDIGTDHGYLLLELFKDGFDKLLAVEKNKGPYDNCKETLARNNMLENTMILLSDGLDKVLEDDAKEYDNIIIAGMGGGLIRSIIEKDFSKFRYSRLILQPNNNEYALRKFLNENEIKIMFDDILEENGKIYEIIVCEYTKGYKEELTEEELYFGLKTKYKRVEFLSKWQSEYSHLEKIYEDLKLLNTDQVVHIKKQMNLINGVLS